jgi:PAS domain S-box-containing protein
VSHPAEMIAWAAGPRTLSPASRVDEVAVAIHSVVAARVAVTMLAALMGLFILPWSICAAWAAGSMVLEVWCWFATRPPSQGRPATWRMRGTFIGSYSGISVCWLLLGALYWHAGSTEGHATAAALFTAVAALTVLLFYSAPVAFLVAGMAPAIAALIVIGPADALDGRHMLPVWLMLGLSAIFSVGRALDAPSVQQSQRRINDSLRNYEILAENITELISRTSMEGRREYISPGCLAMLGYRPDELVGTLQRDFQHPDDLALVTATRQRMLANPGQSQSMTIRVRHKDGTWRWLQANTRVILEDGVAVGVISVNRDVTEQVAAEAALVEAKAEAESANRAKAEFLANVSHEIRTPMNGVLGALHLMDREPISPEGRELIRHANDCGRMLSQLLNDVLDFSKIEAGQLEMAPEPMQAGEALEAVITLVGEQARAKGVDLRCEIVGGDLWIEADPLRVRQAMFNLLGNAVKFTSQGHVVARLLVTAGGDGRRHVALEVEDTGIGMSPEAQSHLFERFRQAEGDTARRFGGTGLGLSITQALTRMMGGDITFSSVEGRGSTFHMRFDAAAAAPASPVTAEDGLLDGVNILLVEDNPTNRLVARTMLARLGATVDEAEDGLAGLEAARLGGHDLILMDVQMPHMDGIQATRAIRGLADAVARVPIIGLTANVMVHQLAEYLAAGMDGVVAKPISPAALMTEIARVLAALDEAQPMAAADAA